MAWIALVGSGFIATQHADAYASIDGATVDAVASTNEAREEFAARHADGADTYPSLERLLAERDPDVVDVCTPTHTHRELVETAVEAGADVLCEKPIAPNLADAAAIADAVRASDVTFMVGHILRFWPAYLRIKREVEAGAVGDPGVIRARRSGPFPDRAGDGWYADREKSGGVLVDLSIHDFDYLRWVLGDVEEVFVRPSRWESESGPRAHAASVLRFPSGAVAHVEGSWAQPASREFSFGIEVAGDEGLLEYDGATATPFALYTDEAVETYDPGDERPMVDQLEHFLECRRTGATPRVPIEEAIASLRLALAARESAQRGEAVAVSEVGE
jgi:predicted dehydrogenase